MDHSTWVGSQIRVRADPQTAVFSLVFVRFCLHGRTPSRQMEDGNRWVSANTRRIGGPDKRRRSTGFPPASDDAGGKGFTQSLVPILERRNSVISGDAHSRSPTDR